MNKIKWDKPFKAQVPFFKAKTRYVAYGGSRGGGKSWAVRLKASLLCLKYAGIRVLIVRRSYAELRENHIIPLIALLSGIGKYNDSDKAFTFPNKSRLKFGYCSGDSDLGQYQGVEYDVVFIDEATQITEFQFLTINATVRGTNSFPKRTYLTCNPGGVGHTWVKRLFIDKEYKNDERECDYTFIKALVFDNDAIMTSNSDYVRTLEKLPENLKRAWLYGDWDIFEGRFFPEFSRDVHVVEPFPIPNEWRRYRAIDYGLDCFACLFVAVDNFGKMYVYKEINESDLIVSDAAKRMKEYTIESEDIYQTFAPPDLWNRCRETGRSTAEIFMSLGEMLIKVDNNRIQGWQELKEALKVKNDCQGVKSADLLVFSNCKRLIKSLGEIQIDDKNPNDCAQSPHDITHIVDALRYFLRGRPKGNRVRKNEAIYNFTKEKPKPNVLGVGQKIKVV